MTLKIIDRLRNWRKLKFALACRLKKPDCPNKVLPRSVRTYGGKK